MHPLFCTLIAIAKNANENTFWNIKKIYWLTFCISFALFGIQFFMAPVSIRLPFGALVFMVMAILHGPLCNLLMEKYEIHVEKSKFFNIKMVFFLVSIAASFFFSFLYILFIPLK